MGRPATVVIRDGDFVLTQDAVCILVGCSKPTLNKWHKEEHPPPRNTDGSYSALDIGKWMREKQPLKRGPGRPKERDDETGVGMNEAERRLKVAQAIKIERQNDVEMGLLLPVEEVERTWQTILMRVRQRFLKMPSVLAPIVLGDPDASSIEEKIKGVVHDALTEASEDWRDGVETDDGNQ